MIIGKDHHFNKTLYSLAGRPFTNPGEGKGLPYAYLRRGTGVTGNSAPPTPPPPPPHTKSTEKCGSGFCIPLHSNIYSMHDEEGRTPVPALIVELELDEEQVNTNVDTPVST